MPGDLQRRDRAVSTKAASGSTSKVAPDYDARQLATFNVASDRIGLVTGACQLIAQALMTLLRVLQRFTLTCGREERFLIAVSLLPRASTVYNNK